MPTPLRRSSATATACLRFRPACVPPRPWPLSASPRSGPCSPAHASRCAWLPRAVCFASGPDAPEPLLPLPPPPASLAGFSPGRLRDPAASRALTGFLATRPRGLQPRVSPPAAFVRAHAHLRVRPRAPPLRRRSTNRALTVRACRLRSRRLPRNPACRLHPRFSSASAGFPAAGRPAPALAGFPATRSAGSRAGQLPANPVGRLLCGPASPQPGRRPLP